ncbi:hypothetical protein LIER_11859 [Lithospermum erythrorhizon]|uniref:Uncharacterized protein n=1 Tax=Lithospermum erythrorhizon TaxID=34254 RepID=A0AAV3PQT1_LITER
MLSSSVGPDPSRLVPNAGRRLLERVARFFSLPVCLRYSNGVGDLVSDNGCGDLPSDADILARNEGEGGQR